MKNKLKICFMGGKQAGIIGALTVLSKGHTILSAVSYSDDLHSVLSGFDVPLFKSIKDEKFIDSLRGCDLLLSVHGREIVPQAIIKTPRLGAINVHPFLYKYKGADPIGRALADKEPKGSVGVHYMTDKVDEGEVIAEEFVDVSGIMSVDGVYNKLYPYYSKAILKALEKLS